MGAEIIQEDGSVRLADPRRDYPHMTARVGLTGKYAIYHEKDNFQGKIPAGWQEIENP